MFDIKDKVEDIVDHVEEIGKTYYRLSVVKATEKGSKLGASLVMLFFATSLLFFTMFFVCMGLSWWIGQRLNNQMMGYFIVAGGLLLILLLIILCRKKIMNFIRNQIINKIYG